MPKTRKLALLGGGVSMLLTAFELLARDLDIDLTIFRDRLRRFSAKDGVGIMEDPELEAGPDMLISTAGLHEAYLAADKKWRELAEDPDWEDLVRISTVRYFYADANVDLAFLDGYAPECNVRILREEQLGERYRAQGYVVSVQFETALFSPPRMLERLEHVLKESGVTFIDEVVDQTMTFDDFDLVVEGVGAGRRKNFGDPRVSVKRGQTLRLRCKPGEKHGIEGCYGVTGSELSANVVAWDDETLVVGAEKAVDNWSEEPDSAVSDYLLRVATELCPVVATMEIEASPVGFRPITGDGKVLFYWENNRRLILNGLQGGGWSVRGLAVPAADQIECKLVA